MLLITTILPITALAGDEENPEITDVTGEWFYEDPSTPEMLYTTIKITNPRVIPFKQHLVVSWQMSGEHYASMLGIGYSLTQWLAYVSVVGRGSFGDPKPVVSFIEGSFDTTKGTITCIIPKSTIGSDQYSIAVF